MSAFLSCYYCAILTLLSCSRSSCARDDIHTALVIVLQLYYSHDLLVLMLLFTIFFCSCYYCDILGIILCSLTSRDTIVISSHFSCARAPLVFVLLLCYSCAPPRVCVTNCASLAPLSCSCYNCAKLALVILTCCLFPWFLVVILLLTKVTR